MTDSTPSGAAPNGTAPTGARPAPGAVEKLDRLKALLREMFQLDRGDLDFGLYRIMNLKTAEVAAFLDRDLLPQVKTKLDLDSSEEWNRLERELEKARWATRELGVDPRPRPPAQDRRAEPPARRDEEGHGRGKEEGRGRRG